MRRLLSIGIAIVVVLAGCTQLREGNVQFGLDSIMLLEVNGQWNGTCWSLEQHGNKALVVTAAHCIWPGSPSLRVLTSIGEYPGTLVYLNRSVDVALLIVTTQETFVDLDLAEPRYGEACWACGFIQGSMSSPPTPVVYSGHVCAPYLKGLGTLTNTGAYLGMSGGPVLNKDGKVIAMVYRCLDYQGKPLDSSQSCSLARDIQAARNQLFVDVERDANQIH